MISAGYALWEEPCNYGDYNDVTREIIGDVPKGKIVQLAVYRKLR